MVCIYCGSKTKTINSRKVVRSNQTWRRRQCLECSSIFTSRESVDYDSAVRVLSSQKRLESLSRDRLFIDIFRSLSHRKTALNDAGSLTDTTLIALLTDSSNGIISSKEIVIKTIETLKRFDKVAAAVYVAHHQNRN